MNGESHTDQWSGSRRPLVGIVAIGIVLRLAHFWFVVHTPWPQHHLMLEYDDFMNFQWAQTILAGDWLGRETYHPYTKYMQMMAPLETWYQWWGGKEIFHQAPLYPYFLAVLLGACSESVPCVLLVQLLLGSVQPLVLYALATRLFDRRAGLIAAALAAAYGPFIFHEAALLRDWLLPILEALAVLLLLKARVSQKPGGWVLAGAVLGLAVLTKESALVLLLLTFGWVVLEGAGTRHARGWAAACVIAGVVLSLSPLIMRNLVVGAPFYAISNRFAEVVVASNSGRSIEDALPPIMQVSQGKAAATVVALLDSFRTEPQRLLEIWLWKFKMLKDPFEVPNNVSFYFGQHISPVLRWSFGYALVFPLGMAGFALCLSSWRQRSLLFVYGLACVIWLMLISSLSRYRLSLVPVLIMFAAGLLVQTGDAARLRNLGRLTVIFCFVLASVVFQRWVLPLPDGAKHTETYLLDYWASARVYAGEGRYEQAAAEMGRLLSLARGVMQRTALLEQSEADYASYRASALIEQGRLEEARVVVDEGTTALLGAHHERGDGTSYPLLNFAVLYVRLDEPAKAIPLLKRFLEQAPNDPLADRAKRLLTRLEQSADPAETGLPGN